MGNDFLFPIQNRHALRYAPLLRLLPPLRPPNEAVAPKPAAKQPNVLLQGAALLQQGAGDKARCFPNKSINKVFISNLNF